ncbi:MAG: pyruvate formate lyase family protein [Verrucomicrobiota bacterium]
METVMQIARLSYRERLDSLHATKLRQTAEKQQIIGDMDFDDWALVLPPHELRKVVKTMGSSGAEIKDCLLSSFEPEPNHPRGGFFGAKAVGKNYRSLLEVHPTYVDPMSSLAGAYMTNFYAYRQPHWNPDFSYSFLEADQKKYRLVHGIGGVQHLCQDLAIGLELGWGGLRAKIGAFRAKNTDDKSQAFYDGLEDVVSGMQGWIRRTADSAAIMALAEYRPDLQENLEQIADMNRRLILEPPSTFREACQWILWYQLAARMFNGSGALGRLDNLLLPYYERDMAQGLITDEDAIFHIACLLLRDTGYIQLGGYDAMGNDDTSHVSFLVLDAIDRLRIPANIAIAVGEKIDQRLLSRGVEMILRNKNGIPKFLGVDQTAEGFTKYGFPLPLGYQRVYSGCNWSALPGLEYTLNDILKINLGVVFDVALHGMMEEGPERASLDALWNHFSSHLNKAAITIATGMDFHLDHMGDVFPELALSLLCHGPIEKGRDASDGGLELYNIGVDAAALATVADSFAAIEQRICIEKCLSWDELLHLLDSNWTGPKGEEARLLMNESPRFGSGGSIADTWAKKIASEFSQVLASKPTPKGRRLNPGIFGWALAVSMGRELGATPNGRHAGDPISHGANPHPGFRKDGALTALAVAVASVQPGYGNTAPLQMDADSEFIKGGKGSEIVEGLINGHFDLGGTQINLNVIDAATILEAYKDPAAHPELVVRVTGFSAYFASLSPEMRKFVVDRLVRN